MSLDRIDGVYSRGVSPTEGTKSRKTSKVEKKIIGAVNNAFEQIGLRFSNLHANVKQMNLSYLPEGKYHSTEKLNAKLNDVEKSLSRDLRKTLAADIEYFKKAIGDEKNEVIAHELNVLIRSVKGKNSKPLQQVDAELYNHKIMKKDKLDTMIFEKHRLLNKKLSLLTKEYGSELSIKNKESKHLSRKMGKLNEALDRLKSEDDPAKLNEGLDYIANQLILLQKDLQFIKNKVIVENITISLRDGGIVQ